MTQAVTILGAGFSRALSSAMPLTDELGDLVLTELHNPGGLAPRRYRGYFEAWLSRLAEDQPDLNAAQNQYNKASFESCRTIILEKLLERQRDATSCPSPPWLSTLCSIWHQDAATVVSFNYDTLVEFAVNSHQLFDWDLFVRVQADDIINRLPPYPPGPARFGPGPMPHTIQLLKLHGSLAWFAAPEDQVGATLARRTVWGGWGSPDDPDPREVRRELPGRVPFIVPPASAKSAYYRNPVLRQLWQDAGDAIAAADEIHLVGYSMPAADLTTRGMLAERSSHSARWVIVNPDADGVRESLAGIGVTSDRTHCYESVEAYVENLERHATEEVVRQILQLSGVCDPDAPVVLSWGEPNACELSLSLMEAGASTLTAVGMPRSLRPLLSGLIDRSTLTYSELANHLRVRSTCPPILAKNKRSQVIGCHFVQASAGRTPMDCLILSIGDWPYSDMN